MDDKDFQIKKQRLKEIEMERRILAEERNEIENAIKESKQEHLAKERMKYIGKCYKRKLGSFIDTRETQHIKAFKILGISDNKNNLNHARCVVVSTKSYNCWTSMSIINRVVNIWGPDEDRLIAKSKTLMIDNYEECSNEEFNAIINKHMEKIINHSEL